MGRLYEESLQGLKGHAIVLSSPSRARQTSGERGKPTGREKEPNKYIMYVLRNVVQVFDCSQVMTQSPIALTLPVLDAMANSCRAGSYECARSFMKGR